jgi:DNA repair exonuclease SbcCD ATPase subunit
MAFEAAANKLKMFNDAHTRYETSMLSMKEKEGQYQDSLTLIQENLRLTESEIEKATELKTAVKMFISISFDDALESIGEAATKIIRCIPTMSNATIQFEGQKETKDGKVKEEVNAVISMDGEVGIPIKSLSGGERSSVDLAVDLAVIDFVESESAKGIDVFILDEPFTGLDTVSIEMALEVLKNSNSKKKLIVVDHNPEVKEMVSNRLVVVREGTTSSITSQEVTNG